MEKDLIKGLFVLASVLTTANGGSIAYAGCGFNCIGAAVSDAGKDLGGEVSDGTKHIGGALANLSHDAQREVAQMPANLSKIWHDVYGVIPDWARDYFNEYAAEAIGAYFGGLQGAALGKVVHDVYASIEKSIIDVKKAKGENLPEYVLKLINAIGLHSGSFIAMASKSYGPDSHEYSEVVKFLDDLQDEYLILARSAQSEAEALKILKKFDKEFADFNYSL